MFPLFFVLNQITFGDVAENHVRMQKIGIMSEHGMIKVSQTQNTDTCAKNVVSVVFFKGFCKDDLLRAKAWMEAKVCVRWRVNMCMCKWCTMV